MKLIKILKLLETKKSFNKRKKVWTKITKRKISINEAKNLYKELMQKDFDELKKEKSSTKKNNILKPLENINAIFTATYLHYGMLPKETKFERSFADRIKSRKERLDIINKNKENIKNELFKEYFNYSNTDTMIKILKDAGDEKNH